jgi:hypothetical protein
MGQWKKEGAPDWILDLEFAEAYGSSRQTSGWGPVFEELPCGLDWG